MKKGLLYFLVSTIIFLGFYEQSEAIPAFARKYQLSCQTCHSPAPRLKPYGDEFAGNGFAISDKEAPRYFVETGDPELTLIRDLPLALRFDGYLSYNKANSDKSDVIVPSRLSLFSGGVITNDVGYYINFYVSEFGKIVGLEDVYVVFNNLFGSELDLYAGQFQVADPLFKSDLRLTHEKYNVYRSKPKASKSSLGYNRGIMLAYGTDFGTDIVAIAVNGNGIGGADELNIFDNDKYKNFAGRISQDIFDFLRIGAFAYYGREEQNISDTNALFNNAINDILIFGPDITIALGDIAELNLQYLIRNDDNTLFDISSPAKKVKTDGAMAELIITPQGGDGKWYGVALLNWIDSELDEMNYKTATGHIGYLLKRNIRIVGEFTYDFSIKNNEFSKFSLGVITAF